MEMRGKGRAQAVGGQQRQKRQAAKPHIGYVPDRPTVYGWMRVRQAVDFCQSLYRPRWNILRCEELLRVLRLKPERRVKHLSKGEGAKLSLLLATGHDPAVLILDEPTGGFDVLARDEFLEGVLNVNLMAADRGQPRTVLFSSHALGDVQRLADSVAILHEGRLVLHRPLAQLLETTKRIRTVLEDTTPARDAVAPPGTVLQSVSAVGLQTVRRSTTGWVAGSEIPFWYPRYVKRLPVCGTRSCRGRT